MKSPQFDKMSWFNDTFGFVTPYMMGRGNYKLPDKLDEKLSIPAGSFYVALEKHFDKMCSSKYVQHIPDIFSLESYQIMTGDETAPKEDLLERIMIEMNLEKSKYDFNEQPLNRLFSGILYRDNYWSLSENDFEKWLLAYCPPNLIKTNLNRAVKSAIVQQNGMIREIVAIHVVPIQFKNQWLINNLVQKVFESCG